MKIWREVKWLITWEERESDEKKGEKDKKTIHWWWIVSEWFSGFKVVNFFFFILIGLLRSRRIKQKGKKLNKIRNSAK